MRISERKLRRVIRGMILEGSGGGGTHVVDIGDGNHVLVSQWVIGHIQKHNEPGEGSVFKSGITEKEIVNLVKEAGNQVQGDGGLYTLKKSGGVGYDLVMSPKEAKKILKKDYSKKNKEVVVKKERGQDVEVLGMRTSLSIEDFSTDAISLVIRPSNPEFLPDDVKEDDEVLSCVESGKSYSLLTAFPGNPDIPPASQWGGTSSPSYVVIIPDS